MEFRIHQKFLSISQTTVHLPTNPTTTSPVKCEWDWRSDILDERFGFFLAGHEDMSHLVFLVLVPKLSLFGNSYFCYHPSYQCKQIVSKANSTTIPFVAGILLLYQCKQIVSKANSTTIPFVAGILLLERLGHGY